MQQRQLVVNSFVSQTMYQLLKNSCIVEENGQVNQRNYSEQGENEKTLFNEHIFLHVHRILR